MSESYGTADPTARAGTGSADEPGTVNVAKAEATDVKDTALDAASSTVSAARDEAAAVGREAKGQLQDLYGQTRRELSEQASRQQSRVASGLQAMGSDLDSMAGSTSGAGIAGELVQRVADGVAAAGSWLDDREPADLLAEVKGFARRRPGVFILAAAVAGLVAGRATRAFLSDAKDPSPSDHESRPRTEAAASAAHGPEGAVAEDPDDDEPHLYTELATRFGGDRQEVWDDERDPL